MEPKMAMITVELDSFRWSFNFEDSVVEDFKMLSSVFDDVIDDVEKMVPNFFNGVDEYGTHCSMGEIVNVLNDCKCFVAGKEPI